MVEDLPYLQPGRATPRKNKIPKDTDSHQLIKKEWKERLSSRVHY